MKYLPLLLCLTLCGCPSAPIVYSDYMTRMVCVDYEEQTVDVEWMKKSRIAGEPDRCGTARIDYGRWMHMTEDDVFAEVFRGLMNSDDRFGAACAKKGK